MNKKLFYISIILIAILIISGCTGNPTIPGSSVNEESKIRSVIHEYALAINAQNWTKAQSYCVYGSERYYAIAEIRDIFNTLHIYCNTVTINLFIDVSNIYINGNYAQAYLTANLIITGCGEVYTEQDSGITHLQKIGNSWKFY